MFLKGLINNVLYVIILSAALDLVGPTVPKGVVLLADVIPSFLTKLIAPYFIHAIPYPVRIVLFVILSAWGMLLIALTPSYTDGGTITTKMAGVILASLSSGGGELSFISLVHFYGPFSLAAWGSGTGGAGLIGAGAYALATTSFGLSVRTTLLASATLPVIMLFGFFVILPGAPLKHFQTSGVQSSNIVQQSASRAHADVDYEDLENLGQEDEGLLASTSSVKSADGEVGGLSWKQFKTNLKRAGRLFFPL